MAGKSLIGELNNAASRTRYTGSTTDSVRITVDNSNMTISGDVIWTDALGEIASRAYPGDKGARNYQKIRELTAKLDNELAQASKFRSSSTTELKTIANMLRELQSALDDEICRAKQEENELHAKTTREIDRSITTDNELFRRIQDESSARKKSGAELVSMINATNLDVTHESERAQETEFLLNERIQDVEDHLRLEDSFLQRQISELITKVDTDTVRLYTTDGTPHVYATTGSYQHTFPVSEKGVADSIVKRDQYGNILLDTDAAITDDSAAPKQYVDRLVDVTRANIMSRLEGIEFIDGGNAPI